MSQGAEDLRFNAGHKKEEHNYNSSARQMPDVRMKVQTSQKLGHSWGGSNFHGLTCKTSTLIRAHACTHL